MTFRGVIVPRDIDEFKCWSKEALKAEKARLEALGVIDVRVNDEMKQGKISKLRVTQHGIEATVEILP